MVGRDRSALVEPVQWADPPVAGARRPFLRRWAPLLSWLGCLLSGLLLLHWLGEGFATPPVTAPAAWWSWATTADPLVVAMAVLRVLALGLAWYLTGVTSISVVARLLRAARLVRAADALAFGPVRVVLQQAVGAGLAAGVLITTVPSAHAPAPARPATAGPGMADVEVMVPADGGPSAVPRPRDEAVAAAPTGLALTDPTRAPVPAPQLPSVTTEAAAADGHTAGSHERRVRAGDHFWSIAAEEVAVRLGRPGTAAEVGRYWEALLAANAERLVVKGNPDLLLPGQRLLLPEMAS